MKKLTLVVLASIVLSSCATHHGLTKNFNQHTTEVVLSHNNFKIVKIVKGEAEAKYVFGIGGLSKNGLIAQAKSDMLASANMEGNSRTIINETVEIKKSGLPFISKYKVIVSAQIIEFTN
ncbi:MAG: DUF6567 family protein [Algibacter sp.]|uniref:DUF6567 family protein n=1 Tax=Algibacter sp. TaxID=1872428 RepID=UPI0032981737